MPVTDQIGCGDGKLAGMRSCCSIPVCTLLLVLLPLPFTKQAGTQSAAVTSTEIPYPKLEEIFAKRPMQGFPPKNLRLSADGQRLLAMMVPKAKEAVVTASKKSTRPETRYQAVLINTRSREKVLLPFAIRKAAKIAFLPKGHAVIYVHKKRCYQLGEGGKETSVLLSAKQDFESIVTLPAGHLYLKAGDEHWLIDKTARSPRKIKLSLAARIIACSKNGKRILYRIRDSGSGDSGGGKPPKLHDTDKNDNKLATMGWFASSRGKELNFILPGAPYRSAFSSDGLTAVFATRKRPTRGPKRKVPDYLTAEVSFKDARSSRIGDAAALSTVHLVRFRSGKVELRKLRILANKSPGDLPMQIRSLAFGPRDRKLLIQTLSNDAHERQLFLFEGKMLQPRLLLKERDESWIGPLALWADFDASGKAVLFSTERDDKARLYRLIPGEKTAIPLTAMPLTPADVELASVKKLKNGKLLLGLGDAEPRRRSIHVLTTDTGKLERVLQGSGWNSSAVMSRNGQVLAFLHASLFRPAEIFCVELSGKPTLRQLSSATPQAFHEYPWIRPSFIRYKNPMDDEWIHAQLFLPKGEPPKSGWPAVIFLHGAGYLQNVTDSMTRYVPNLLFHHRLAARGYVVLNPDFRGSAGYGAKFRGRVYKDLGGPDRRDVIAARAYLARKASVDPERIGLYGGSYGGFLTLMCMFKDPDAFACGAAMRSVTDWMNYHPSYTHPRLGSPNDRGGEEVYRRTSPIHFAQGLKRPLLIFHGLMDDNVFAQDSLRLTEKLIELGKDFDAMFYPSQKHGFKAPAAWIDEYKRIEKLFDTVLKR